MNLKLKYCAILSLSKTQLLNFWGWSKLFANKLSSHAECKQTEAQATKVTNGFGHYAQQTASQLDQLFEQNQNSSLVVSLQGPWGVGKTYFWNAYTSSKLNSRS